MFDPDTSNAASLKKIETETRKLEAEILKLQIETAAVRRDQWRAWLVTLSLVVGIGVSAVGVYETLAGVAFRYQQLGLESQVKSTEIFLNQVLDRMSGIKVVRTEVNESGVLTLKSRDSYGDVIQVGSYGAAVSLACQFGNLRLATQSALTFQLAVQPNDLAARDMLQRIESECPLNWERLTAAEKANWSAAAANDRPKQQEK